MSCNNTFYFKQFSIKQSDSAMKVGTDGVLIGSWVLLSNSPNEILDIGAGTGLISIMMAQRTNSSIITGIEIESGAAMEANYNAAHSQWNNRISIQNISCQEFSLKDENRNRFNLIISNPPYFNGTYKSNQIERSIARHYDSLSIDDLIDSVTRLLHTSDGRFATIFPYDIGAIFIAKAAVKGLYCNRICYVYPKKHKSAKRIMIELSMEKSNMPIITEQLIIAEDSGEYTSQYKQITKDFYLKF